MKKVFLAFLFLTVFSLPVFAQNNVNQNNGMAVGEASTSLDEVSEKLKLEDADAFKNNCITRNEARVLAKEGAIKVIGRDSDWYRWDDALGKFNGQKQEWFFFFWGKSDSFGDHFGIALSCRGEVLRVSQGR